MARRGVSRTGALLLDVVVAGSVLTVVLFFVLNLFPSASLLLHQARHKGYALEMGRSALEDLRAQPFRTLKAGENRALPERTVPGATLRAQVSLNAVPGVPAAQLLEARVDVRWEDALGTHESTFGGYILAPQ